MAKRELRRRMEVMAAQDDSPAGEPIRFDSRIAVLLRDKVLKGTVMHP